jgi:hypothetical protein
MKRAVAFVAMITFLAVCKATAVSAIKIRIPNSVNRYEIKKGNCFAFAAKTSLKAKSSHGSLSYYFVTAIDEQSAINAVVACEYGYVCVLIMSFCNDQN